MFRALQPRAAVLAAAPVVAAAVSKSSPRGACISCTPTIIPTAQRTLSTCFAVVVYISEGRNSGLLDILAQAARTGSDSNESPARLIRQFRDTTYHRTGFTIGGTCPSDIIKASLAVSRLALRHIDLRTHEATHPRIGVVDHVSVHPLGRGAQRGAEEIGISIATALGVEDHLPVLLYGDLKGGKGLAEVRRSTPYFSGGNVPTAIDADLGPRQVDASKGMVTVGCTPLVINYNILLNTHERHLAVQVTRHVREKDGGLPWVEALTLTRADGRYEAACNLLRPKETTPSMVLDAAKEKATALGIQIVDDYETGLTEEQAIAAIFHV